MFFYWNYKNKLIYNLLMVSFLIVLSFIGYQHNITFYLVLFLYITFILIKNFTHVVQLLTAILLLLLNNFAYLILPSKFTIIKEIGLIKFIINNTSVAAVNLFLICLIFYHYSIILKKKYPELISVIFSSKFQNIINIMTLIILIISECIMSDIRSIISMPKLYISIYSILMSFVLVRTFPKGIMALINTVFIILVLVSPLITLFFYLVLRVNYIPSGRYFFLADFFPYIYLPIALVCTSIITILPQRYFAAQVSNNKLKFFVAFCLMMFLVNLKNIPAFKSFF